jgi:CRISPR/Cas system CSM-associated protein Csm2 small subunit
MEQGPSPGGPTKQLSKADISDSAGQLSLAGKSDSVRRPRSKVELTASPDHCAWNVDWRGLDYQKDRSPEELARVLKEKIDSLVTGGDLPPGLSVSIKGTRRSLNYKEVVYIKIWVQDVHLQIMSQKYYVASKAKRKKKNMGKFSRQGSDLLDQIEEVTRAFNLLQSLPITKV